MMALNTVMLRSEGAGLADNEEGAPPRVASTSQSFAPANSLAPSQDSTGFGFQLQVNLIVTLMSLPTVAPGT